MLCLLFFFFGKNFEIPICWPNRVSNNNFSRFSIFHSKKLNWVGFSAICHTIVRLSSSSSYKNDQETNMSHPRNINLFFNENIFKLKYLKKLFEKKKRHMTIDSFFLLFPKTRTGYQVPTFKFETQFFLFFFCVYFKKKLVNHLNVQKLKKKKRQVSKSFQKRFFATILLFSTFLRKICEQARKIDLFLKEKEANKCKVFVQKKICKTKVYQKKVLLKVFFFSSKFGKDMRWTKKHFGYLFRILVSKRKRGSQKLSFERKSKPKFFSSSKKKNQRVSRLVRLCDSKPKKANNLFVFKSRKKRKSFLKKKLELKLILCAFFYFCSKPFRFFSIQSVFFRFRKLCLVCCFFLVLCRKVKKKVIVTFDVRAKKKLTK